MRKKRLVLLCCVLPAMVGCGGQWLAAPGGVRMWAAPDSAILLPNQVPELENEVYSSTSRLVRLEAAVNETVSFQLGFRGELGSPKVLAIKIADLKQSDRVIPAAGQVRMYREARIPVDNYPAWFLRLTPNLREHREYPDILVPLEAPRGALPIPLRIGGCEAVWVDITVPPGTEPGLYRSTIEATYPAGMRERAELTLTVHPFSLPLTQHLPVITGVDSTKVLKQHLEIGGRPYAPKRLALDDPAYPKAVAVLDQTIRVLHEHRCSAMLTDLQPLRKLDSQGRLELDWADYDRLVAAVLDGSSFEDRVPALAWPMPVDDVEPAPELNGGWGSKQYGEMLVEYLRQCAEHFQQRGWIDRQFVWIPLPEPRPTASPYSQFAWLGSVIQRADARLATVCNLAPQPMKDFGAVNDAFQDVSQWVSIWAPPTSNADSDVLMAARKAGKRTWLNPDRPPYSGSLSIIAPAVHARSLAWQCYRSGYDAIFLPRTTNWREDGTSDEAGSASVLLWPGKPYGLGMPVPSIRLKRLLRGVQDYEYLWLLERNQRPAVAGLIAADLFAFGGTGCYGEHFLDSRPNGWVSKEQAWPLARSLMAKELAAAIEQTEQRPSSQPELARPPVVDFARNLDWRRHVEGVRRVDTAVEGLRVRLNPEHADAPLSIHATVSVFNATREPHSATIDAGKLPQGWSAGVPAKPVERLQPTHSVIREVELRTGNIASSVEGVMPLTFVTTPTAGQVSEIPARLCVMTAQRLTVPVVLDGKLNEWPLATNNAAGDFLLVGALDVPKTSRPNPDRASQQTMVFAGYSDDALYLAFSCHDDHMAQRIVTQGNQIRYDDLWPAGEDVVEIVLDPSGNAIAPEDLRHIVIKANGAVVTERGAPCLAAVGGYGDWPGEVVAAIDDRSQPDRWSVEVRIPLRSLGKLAPIWGINFARYHARLGEYSAWTAVRRYCYSPASLGNIQFAP